MSYPNIKQIIHRILCANQLRILDPRQIMRHKTGTGGIIQVLSFSLFVLVLLYCFNIVGCKYFPLLAQGCMEPSLLFKILYGLLYTLVVLTLIFVPLLAIIFFRVTIVMPISKWIYGDENTLDARYFGWFDKCWSVCQKLLLK